MESIRNPTLSVVFVTSQKIKSLNKKFLGRNCTTDVLAFDLTNNRNSYNTGKKVKVVYGEVIISTDTVIKNSKKYKTEIYRELSLYIIHGIIHLLGYDDHSLKDIRRMRKKENSLLELLSSKIKKVVY